MTPQKSSNPWTFFLVLVKNNELLSKTILLNYDFQHILHMSNLKI